MRNCKHQAYVMCIIFRDFRIKMIVNPIIPIWLMSVICIILLVLKRKGIFPYIRQIIVILLLFVINLRIMIPDEIEVSSPKIDAKVIFVIDNTIGLQW